MTTSNPDGHFRISINAPPAREYGSLLTSDDYKGYSPRRRSQTWLAVKVAMSDCHGLVTGPPLCVVPVRARLLVHKLTNHAHG